MRLFRLIFRRTIPTQAAALYVQILPLALLHKNNFSVASCHNLMKTVNHKNSKNII